MKHSVRAVVVAGVAGGMVFGGHLALRAAPGQTPAPPTAAQLSQLHEKLADQATQDERTLRSLQERERMAEATLAQLHQQAALYRAQLVRVASPAPAVHTVTGASGAHRGDDGGDDGGD